jgi:hypothetical protein
MSRIACCLLLVSACVPPLPGVNNDKDEATLALSSFTLMPGQERYVCQNFANPFGGEAAIARFDSHMTAGAHHLIVFFQTGGRDGSLEDCSGNEFAAGPYGSQRLDDSLSYPSGVAANLPATTGLRIQAHYLNASQSPVTPTVQLTMKKASGITQPAAVLFMSNLDISVPAGATAAAVSKTCKLPFDVKLVQASGHMHRHGTSFVARTPDRQLFSSTMWSDVEPAFFDPPLALSSGTDVTFTCTYDNPGNTPLVYGDSAETDEMCIFSAQFFPAPFGGWSCF